MTETEHNKIHKTGNKYHLGKHHSEETKKKLSESQSKSILQYTKDGTFIQEWIGTREVERVLGINHGHIVSCCKGKLKSAGGFVWSYA